MFGLVPTEAEKEERVKQCGETFHTGEIYSRRAGVYTINNNG